jgi:hypothetical protein
MRSAVIGRAGVLVPITPAKAGAASRLADRNRPIMAVRWVIWTVSPAGVAVSRTPLF